MVELLVTVVIIGILASMVLGALQMAREAAREAATKATIAKLNSIIMQRYESYMTRRVPILIPAGTPANVAAALRLYALRTLMRAEMPDSLADVNMTFSENNISAGSVTVSLSEPALHVLYRTASPTPSSTWDSAQCLYLIVSRGSPEMMEQFHQSEIGVVVDATGSHPVFVDGWGSPICWLRWAPGYSSWQGTTVPSGCQVAPSDIQTGNAAADSDPFDPRRVDATAFHLIPLICSGGSGKAASLQGITGLADGSARISNIASLCATPTLGTPGAAGFGCITNHHIEAR